MNERGRAHESKEDRERKVGVSTRARHARAPPKEARCKDDQHITPEQSSQTVIHSLATKLDKFLRYKKI